MNLSSKVWQNVTMGLVCGSFIAAHFGNQYAMQMWLEGWEGISMFLGLGVGMKMVKDQVDKNNLRKNKRVVDDPDGG